MFRSFLNGAAIYGIGLVLTRFGWLFLLPIYWKKLSPSDFGRIGITQVMIAVLTPVLSFGLHDAVQRFYLEWSDAERPRHVAAIWTVVLLAGLIFCILLDFLGAQFSGLVFKQIPFDPYIRLAIWTSFFTVFGYFPYAILRIRDRIGVFTLLSVLAFISQAIIIIYLVVIRNEGPVGYVQGLLYNSVVWAVIFALIMVHECRLPFSVRHLRKPLRYGLPIIPVSLLEGTAGLFDRFFLDKYVPLAQLGIYNLGNQIGQTSNLFNQMLKSNWIPFLYRNITERNDGPELLGRYAIYYLAVLALPALAVALLAKQLILFIGDPRYYNVYDLVPWFVLVYFIQAMAASMGRGMDLAKKTDWWLLVPVTGIVVGLTALNLLVPLFGLSGALYALVITASVRVFVQIWLANHFYPRPLNISLLLRLLMACSVLYSLGIILDTGNVWIDTTGKILIVFAAVPIVTWAVAGVHGLAELQRLLKLSKLKLVG